MVLFACQFSPRFQIMSEVIPFFSLVLLHSRLFSPELERESGLPHHPLWSPALQTCCDYVHGHPSPCYLLWAPCRQDCVPQCCTVGKVSATYVCSLNEPVNLFPFKKVGLDNVKSIRPLHFFPEAQGRARNTHLEPSLAVSLEPHLPELPRSCEVD